MTPILTSSSPQFDQFRFSALSQRPQDHFRFSTQFPGEQNQISSIWLLSHKKTQGNKRQGLHGRRSIQIWKHFKQVLCQRLLQLEEEHRALEQDTKGTFTSFLLACRIKPRQGCWKQLPNVSSCLLVGSFLPPPNETFASHNLACSQLSNSHGRRPKMIYTRCFSQHKRPCTAKLQNRCQAIRLHSGGLLHRTARSVLVGLFVLSCFMFWNAVTFFGCALVPVLRDYYFRGASNWLPFLCSVSIFSAAIHLIFSFLLSSSDHCVLTKSNQGRLEL